LSDLQCFVVAFLTTVTRESEACEAWAEGHLREGRRELMLERKLSRILRLLIHHLDQQLVVQETRVVHPRVWMLGLMLNRYWLNLCHHWETGEGFLLDLLLRVFIAGCDLSQLERLDLLLARLRFFLRHSRGCVWPDGL